MASDQLCWTDFVCTQLEECKKRFINDFESKIEFLLLGVSQGRVLGPILLLIYMNGSQNCVKYCTVLCLF